MVPQGVRAVWKSASMRPGEPSALMVGMNLMLELFADSWDSHNSVKFLLK